MFADKKTTSEIRSGFKDTQNKYFLTTFYNKSDLRKSYSLLKHYIIPRALAKYLRITSEIITATTPINNFIKSLDDFLFSGSIV